MELTSLFELDLSSVKFKCFFKKIQPQGCITKIDQMISETIFPSDYHLSHPE